MPCAAPSSHLAHATPPAPAQAHARYANGGAYPPDLSLITKARHNGQNYVYALLMGYREPPAGVSVSAYSLLYSPLFGDIACCLSKYTLAREEYRVCPAHGLP